MRETHKRVSLRDLQRGIRTATQNASLIDEQEANGQRVRVLAPQEVLPVGTNNASYYLLRRS